MNHCDSKSNMDAVLAAIADPTRRAILERLSEGAARVSDLAAPFPMSLNAISKHIKILERAGLVSRERVWREYRISLVPGALDDAATWINEKRLFWAQRLDALGAALEKERARK